DGPSAGTILVADPDIAVRAAYRMSLLPDQFEVVEASDGREALVRALQKPPSTIIAELRLPLVDGVSLCEILHQDGSTSRVPFVIVTSERDRTSLERARRVADVVLAKPAQPPELVATVHQLIRRMADSISESLALSQRVDASLSRSCQLVRRHAR